jgi:hypothetical protein
VTCTNSPLWKAVALKGLTVVLMIEVMFVSPRAGLSDEGCDSMDGMMPVERR